MGRRGYFRQERMRLAEAKAREHAVSAARAAAISGRLQSTVAASLGVAPRTMRDWEAKATEGNVGTRRRGRRPQRSGVLERNALLTEIERAGPQIGVAPLRLRFPHMAREEIRDILGRMRQWYLREHTRFCEELQWTQPGWVWAMDHTQPPGAVEGIYRAVFSLRDLGSGAQLAWSGQLGPGAQEVTRELQKLFERHGAPLVLKCDNGSAFISQEVQDLCTAWGVKLLWSPPRMPGYNGAVESSIRWLKERTDHAACRRGEEGVWRREDLQVALEHTNDLPKEAQRDPRPRREVFAGRKPVPGEVRREFRRTLLWEQKREQDLRNNLPQTKETRAQRAGIERRAMRRALVALGILIIKMRRVPLTLKSILAAKIS